MNRIEVDPRLFSTCRLCLEDFGLYQIVPAVKELISFCFGINVEPFDGLPQLICKKCEEILSLFAATKKTFITKQNDLIKGSQNGLFSQDQLNAVASTQNIHIHMNKNNPCLPRKRKACPSSYFSASEDNIAHDISNDSYSEESIVRLTNYKRQYVCRICDLQWSNSKTVMAHFRSRHSMLKKKYQNIFKRHCEVSLHKIDGKHNATGSGRKVMYSKEKIIENDKPEYYVLYTPKDIKYDKCNTQSDNDARNSISKLSERSKYYANSDSSNDDIVVKRKRKRRLCSRSSNETVVLDAENKSVTSDNGKESQSSQKMEAPVVVSECINIDDSSDNETEHGDDVAQPNTKIQISEINNENIKTDLVTINETIIACKNKYVKKRYHDNFLLKSNKPPSYIASQLKCKILSIGRKIINKKKGVNCTPLLRFMEHKNLDIFWKPRSVLCVRPDSNYIRIMARSKNIGETNKNESGWTDYISTSSSTSEKTVSSATNTHIDEFNIVISDRKQNKEHMTSFIPEVQYLSILEPAQIDNANLIGTDTKKILNANPVANPKQLPKKSVTNDIKSMKATSTMQMMSNAEITPQENNTDELCMPIITSTTSLAVPVEANNYYSSDTAQLQNKNIAPKSKGPRIKVKSVAELMSLETLSRMQEPIRVSYIVSPTQQLPLQNDNNNMVNIYIPTSIKVSQFPEGLQIMNTASADVSTESAGKHDYVILDTVELPNTTTNSPFQYFRRLLQVHNITLLDTDVTLSRNFHCLIKFKVLYKQETTNQPVILCLALFCTNNTFCLKIKDRNQENINMAKISANWQWEILKIYKGEVVSKVLDNAKKFGQEVYEYTNRFLCLLKSINYIKNNN